MTLDEMIGDVRRELNEPSAKGHLSDNELAAYLNRGQEYLFKKIEEADQNFFEESDQSLGFILNQEEYDLPAVITDRKITRITRTDLTPPRQLDRVRFQEKDRYASFNVFLSGSNTQGEVYYLRGNRLGLKPTPQQNISGNILIHYIRMPHELHWGVVTTATTTTFIMTPSKAGRLQTTPNYYVGAKVRVISSGNARGLERTITAFDVATKVATISPAWTIVDVDTKEYVILTPIPQDYHDVLYQWALMKAAKKIGDRDRYGMAQKDFATLFDQLINSIEPRTFDENQHVRAPVDQQFD